MKSILKIIIGTTIGIVICLLVFFISGKSKKSEHTVSTHREVVEKVEAVGKLELVRMNIRDVLEHKIVREWLPNAQALLIINGEAAGCIDLQKVKSGDVVISKDTLKIKLPYPEICYCKIDHEKSKVFETKNEFLSGAKLVDGAYAEAEKQLRQTVLKAGILEQTKTNAIVLLKPFFETLGFKYTIIYFDETDAGDAGRIKN
jgi:hypothetical protein